MYEWMNGGPGPLDLTTPLAQGVQEGAQAAFRRAQVQLDAARIDQMKQAFGLQEKQQQFEQSKWNSQADMRGIELDSAKQSLATQVRMNEVAANDKSILLDQHPVLDGFVSNKDYTGLKDAQPPAGLSASGVAAWETMKTGYLQGAWATEAAAKNNMTVGTTLDYTSKIDSKPLLNADGTPDVAGMNRELTKLSLSKTQSEQDIKTNAVEEEYTAKYGAWGQARMDVERAKALDTGAMKPIDAQTYKASAATADAGLRSISQLPLGDNRADAIWADVRNSQAKMKAIESAYPGATGQMPSQVNSTSSSIPEGSTIIKDSTGERMIRKNGQWVPLQ